MSCVYTFEGFSFSARFTAVYSNVFLPPSTGHHSSYQCLPCSEGHHIQCECDTSVSERLWCSHISFNHFNFFTSVFLPEQFELAEDFIVFTVLYSTKNKIHVRI